jgi:hypothetical protein
VAANTTRHTAAHGQHLVSAEADAFLDDADRDLVARRRRAHNRLGFAQRLVTVRHLE